MPATVVVTNLKGGSGKTTTTAHLAAALHAAGVQVLVVDADPQGSCLRWSETAEWPWPVVALPTTRLHAQLAGIVGTHQVVIVDTPPTEGGIVTSALRAASLVVVPCAPTPVEIDRLPDLRRVFEDVAPLRADGAPPPAALLLTRTVSGAASTQAWRLALAEDGWRVMRAIVPRREAIAQSFGDPVPTGGPYLVVAEEVTDLLLEASDG